MDCPFLYGVVIVWEVFLSVFYYLPILKIYVFIHDIHGIDNSMKHDNYKQYYFYSNAIIIFIYTTDYFLKLNL